MSIAFNDPLFASQWYLFNYGQRGGSSRLDINVMPAWAKYSGKGVLVAVNDDGIDFTHPALVANLLPELAYDSARGTTGQGFQGSEDNHGTVVTSIIAMPANDGIGGVGVAFGAKIVSGFTGNYQNNAALFLANLAAGAGVSVNSWGRDPAFAENFGASGSAADQAWGAALLRCATEARDGLGMVIEVSAGNERGTRADAAMTNFTSSRLTIAVGAITETGAPTNYSTPGASLLITAPGGTASSENTADNSGFGIASADVQGARGYNTQAGSAGDYAFQNYGTSYSGPMVGGAAALMLEANPNLGFRDVSTILALTARKIDSAKPSWRENGATDWNLGGMHFSWDFGYGLLDVAAAVRLAESWTLPAGTVSNWLSAEGVSQTASGAIPDNPAERSFFVATANVTENVRIERMEFDLDLSADLPSQLSAVVTSPDGTRMILFDNPLSNSPWPSTFTIGSTAFLGESSAGQWTLELLDSVTGTVAFFNSLTVRAWGSAITDDSLYVLTDEFAAANPTLTDDSGVDTLNAAALSSSVTLNLIAGSTSIAGSGSFTLTTNTVIENAIGGLGNDWLYGNGVNNVLRGNGGNDSIAGGNGDDTIDGGAGTDTVLLQVPVSGVLGYTWSNSVLSVTMAGGTQTISQMERVRLNDVLFAFDTQAPIGSDAGGSVWQAAALLRAGFGTMPDRTNLSRWTAEADDSASMGMLGQKIIDFYAPGISSEAFVGYLYQMLVQVAPTADVLAGLVSQIGEGRTFATQGDLFAYAASLSLNTDLMVGFAGSIQQLDASTFPVLA